MNRRSFIADMLKVGVACTFLPGAGRIWKPRYQTLEVGPFVQPQLGLNLQDLLKACYDLKRARERMGYDPDYLYFSKPVNFAAMSTPRVRPLGIYEQMRNA